MATKPDEAAKLNQELMHVLRELRDTSALLRVKAANLTLANRRLLREIHRLLDTPRLP